MIIAFCATLVGLAAVTGAFIVGVLIPYKKIGERLDQRISMMKEIFAVVFFTSIGLSIDPSGILIYLPLILVVFGVDTASRLFGGFIGGRLGKFSGKELWGMTTGLAIQGEVNLIIAQMAVNLGIVGPEFLIIATGVVIGSVLLNVPIYQRLIRSFKEVPVEL